MEKFNNVIYSPFIIKVIKSSRVRGAGVVTCMGYVRNAYKYFVGKPGEKRLQERPRRRWKNNVKLGLKKLGNEDTD